MLIWFNRPKGHFLKVGKVELTQLSLEDKFLKTVRQRFSIMTRNIQMRVLMNSQLSDLIESLNWSFNKVRKIRKCQIAILCIFCQNSAIRFFFFLYMYVASFGDDTAQLPRVGFE